MDFRRESDGEILSFDDRSRLADGAEGVVYLLPDYPELAAKIYHQDKVNAERAAKLRAMRANAPDDPMRNKGHASIAWPLELLSSLEGEIVGFLMPRIRNAHRISDFYDVPTRRSKSPLFSYRHLCRTALNLASAAGAIHERGYIIGDINDFNILATEEALVTLVDTDSFQVTEPDGGRVYRCPVGTPAFTPPELVDKDFDQIDRSQEHDLFGLAVLFFQLLMEGTPPFAGVYLGPGEVPDYDERLARGYFPFGGHPLVSPPPYAPRFETLYPPLQRLFRQCFVDGYADPGRRPDSATWLDAFKKSEQALTVCPRNRQHYYFDHNALCTWCERVLEWGPVYAAKGMVGWDPFPQPGAASAPAGARSVHSATPPSPSPQRAASFAWTPPAASAPSPPVSSFTVSPTAITIGQAVTLSWDVPNAQSVRITDQSGRRVFVGNAPFGVVTVYPSTNKTYFLTASGIGLNLPKPVSVSVTPLPLPVTLKKPSLELNRPVALRAVQVGLRPVISLNEISVRLSTWKSLKRYLPLKPYTALRRASVQLKKYGPLRGATHVKY